MDIGVGPTLRPAPFCDSAPDADSSLAYLAEELSHAGESYPPTLQPASGLRFCRDRFYAAVTASGEAGQGTPDFAQSVSGVPSL